MIGYGDTTRPIGVLNLLNTKYLEIGTTQSWVSKIFYEFEQIALNFDNSQRGVVYQEKQVLSYKARMMTIVAQSFEKLLLPAGIKLHISWIISVAVVYVANLLLTGHARIWILKEETYGTIIIFLEMESNSLFYSNIAQKNCISKTRYK